MTADAGSGRDRSGTVRKERSRKKRWRTLLEACPMCGAPVGILCRMGRGTKTSSHYVYADGPPSGVERTPMADEDFVDVLAPPGHEYNQRLLWDDIPPL